MRILSPLFSVIFFVFISSTAHAQLTPFTDFTVSDEVSLVTTIRVHPNLGNDYLEGIRDTWIASNKIAMELGQIKDFSIYRSDMPQGGDFNLILVVRMNNTADLAPSKARYDAFMKKWGDERVKKNREISKNYPAMREITGEYMMRKVDVK